ncbi:MAG: class I SAM-dependent methyltransferase [Actinomycetota bacterium]|nr:class I SAM-dependent methyltransferase [Actinomycetota bacterium]
MALTLGILVNGLRLRHRLSGLSRLDAPSAGDEPPPADGDEDDYLVVHARGIEVDDATRRAAIAHARTEGLDVVDLVPGDLPLDQAVDVARAVDTTTFRSAPFAAGRGAMHAVVVRRDVWDRMGPPAGPPVGRPAGPADAGHDRAALVRLIEGLKQHAARSTDLAVAPGLHAVEPSPEEHLGQLEALYGPLVPLALIVPAARSLMLLAGLALSPGWGTAAVAAYLAQPHLVTAGRPIRPPDRLVGRAARSLVQPFVLIRSALGKGAVGGAPTDRAEVDPVESRRPVYAELMADGIDGFFERPTTTCPLCGSAELKERLRMPDWVQFKPGEFVLDRCQRCGHIFQNPRLSRAGLAFYYRDVYDGLGARSVEFLFTQAGGSYRGRVDMVRRHVTPKSWLDVGSGYGHFCLSARGSLPETRFDGLDMGESIDEAGRRRWVDHAYRGLFPDLADELAGRYDVVSMHHYLEHTIDPRAELESAAKVLEPGGYLLIEVPDPESRYAGLLGRAWLPWFQPQHLHFFSVANLETALTSRGFSVVDVERGPAHQPLDLAGGLLMRANALAPPRLPWRDPPTIAARAGRALVMTATTPLAALAMGADRALHPLIRTKAQGWSNTYRVLACRNG